MEIRLLITVSLIIAGIATSFSLASQTRAGGDLVKSCAAGSVDYTNEQYGLSFCYPEKYGVISIKETAISPEAKNGTVYYLKFSESVNNSPLLTFSTRDFKRLGDSDVPSVINWDDLNMNDSLDELERLLPADENPVLEKLTINNKTFLKVKIDYKEPFEGSRIVATKYFIPNVKFNDDSYNLYILCSPDMEKDMQTMIASMNI